MLGWIALIVGIIVLAAFTPLLLASFTPPRVLARAVIEKYLTSLGVEPAGFSRQCIDALADEAVESTKRFQELGLNEPGPWRSNLQEHAEGMARDIYATVVGEGDFSAERIREAVENDTAPVAWHILAKHDPKRFTLGALEKTQWTNAVMREQASPHKKSPPPVLYFKSAAAAFEIHCKYGKIAELAPRSPRLALVREHEREQLQDGRQWLWLTVADQARPFTVRALTPPGARSPLQGGELVQWLPIMFEPKLARIPELGRDPRSCWLGFVSAQFAPEMSTASGQFRVIADYSAAIPAD